MKKPLISVVLPLYNREKYIKEAIESILNQTVQNFELLVIDDASTDSSLALVNAFKDSRIKVFSKQKNEGVASAINLGLWKAKGKYIARFDSDDISYPTRFEKQLQILQQNPHIAVCGSWIEMGNGEILRYKQFHHEIQAEMLNRCALSMPTSFWDNEKLDGIFLEEGLRHGEDYEFWSRAISKGEFYNIQEPLIFYRNHDAQISKKYISNQRAMDAEIKLSLFKDINYSANKFPDNTIKKCLALNEHISVEEFKLFLNWLEKIKQLNAKSKVFSPTEFNNVISSIRRKLLFALFFKKNNVRIDKNWRKRAVTKLKPRDLIFILQGKLKERIKLAGKS